MNNLDCKICNRKFDRNIYQLSAHLIIHNISSKNYYDKFIKKCNEGKCKKCDNESKFKTLNIGYAKYCSEKCAYSDRKKENYNRRGKCVGNKNNKYKYIPIEKILELVEKEYSKKKIAEYFSVTPETIDRKLKGNNLIWEKINKYNQNGKNNINFKELPIDKIILLAKNGKTRGEIAKYFSVSYGAIDSNLKLNNIRWKDIGNMRLSGENHPMFGKTHSDETKRKQRLSAIKRIKNKNGIVVNYNKDACIFFDKLNKYMNWNGMHAENHGEYHIKELGYFVDYYEPELNLVIEWDEKSHKYKEEKDRIREKEIKEYLKCGFIRIKENDNKFLRWFMNGIT